MQTPKMERRNGMDELKLRSNAHRLASVLYDYSEDKQKIQILCRTLNYNEEQLKKDMVDLLEYIRKIEKQMEE